MRDELIGTIWVCQCCMLDHANGECCADDQHGGDGIAPWATLAADEHVTMGLLTDEHDEECPRRAGDREAECDCERREFSTSQCEGCGSWLAGDRYAFAAWRAAGVSA